jgi:hypothetical protein
MEEDKDVKAAKEEYKRLRERLKDTKIDYDKLEADMLEMLGEPSEEQLKRVRRIPKHKIGDGKVY